MNSPLTGSIRLVLAFLALTSGAGLAHALLAPQYARVPFASRIDESNAASSTLADSRTPPPLGSDPASTAKPARVRLQLGRWPLELYGIAWSLAVLVLHLSRANGPDGQRRFHLYLFGLASLALGGVLWALYQVSWQRWLIAPQYAYSIACVVACFVGYALLPQAPALQAMRQMFSDVTDLMRRPPAWAAVVLLIMVVFIKYRGTVEGYGPTGSDFDAWFAKQTRVALPLPLPQVGVVLVKFNDYQCPPCKRADEQYRPVLKRLLLRFPGDLHVRNIDYPLNQKCNRYVRNDTHPAACDAAVAVRLAQERGRGSQMEDWLWEHQASLTAATVLEGLHAVASVTAEQFHADYERVLPAIKAEIDAGHTLGIPGTPTYFLNGVRLRLVQPADLERAILNELRAAGVQSASLN